MEFLFIKTTETLIFNNLNDDVYPVHLVVVFGA